MTTKRIVPSLLALGLLAAACSSAVEPPENGPQRGRQKREYKYEGATPAVGDNVEVSVAASERGERQVGFESAGFLRLHFASLDLAAGARLVIESSDGEVLYFGADSNGPDLWAPVLSGSSATVRLEGEGVTGSYAIDQVGVGYPGPGDSLGPLASTCGTNDLVHAVCFITPNNPFNVYNPAVNTAAKSVAQLAFSAGGGTGFCTGFLISDTNLFLTNYHCIPNQAAADTLTVTFNYQSQYCGSQILAPKESITGATFIAGSAQLDYALLRLPTNQVPPQSPPGTTTPLNPAGKYKFIPLDPAPDLRVNETEIYIVQHPGTVLARKQVGYNDSEAGGGRCRVRSVNVDLDGAGDKPPVNVGYHCDTQGGSSGSPVISLATNKVVALHHEGGCPVAHNYGVNLLNIYPEIKCHIDGTQCGGTGGSGGSGGGGGPNSCVGFCGIQAPGGCFCDDSCHNTDDCCPDKDVKCGTGVPDTSCKDHCGDQQTLSGCWCDSGCHNFGDCCVDRDLFCGAP